jgi:putative membrane-bound dehydrogenase-like protein
MLVWQNENTDKLVDMVDRRLFDDLLGHADAGVGAKSAAAPAAGLKSMIARPGFKVEQVAAEPLTMDPVAFAWGPDGKLWVVEMADYPLGIDGKGQPGGRVRYLEDTDGDGHYDRSVLFMSDVPYPTGVLPWKNGVLVSAAPDIFFAADTDGDGKADQREVLYTGFVQGNQQHRVNGLVWGLDNWIHCANGDSGGGVKSMKTGEVVEIRAAICAFGPIRGRSKPRRDRRSSAAVRTIGATGSAATTATRCTSSCSKIGISAAIPTTRIPTRA